MLAARTRDGGIPSGRTLYRVTLYRGALYRGALYGVNWHQIKSFKWGEER